MILCPEKLHFPYGCIRNVLIEFANGSKIITHYKELKKPKNKALTSFF